MPSQRIEIFSLEAGLMQIFAITLSLMGIVQFLSFIFPKRFQMVNDIFDKFIEWVHQYCEILPWLLFASFIAIATPVYDIFLDSAWLTSINETDQKRKTLLDLWRHLINDGSDENSKRDLIHSIQWISAIGMFYIYSLSWMKFVQITKISGTYPQDKIKRGIFFGGFATLIGFFSTLVSKMGQNADFILL
jgi:hypothetical protein